MTDPNNRKSSEETRFIDSDDVVDFDMNLEGATSSGPVGLLGEYLLLRRIGAGGMGEVFLAEHRTMNRHVALKILSRKIADRPQLLERFFQEIRAVAKLMHPNIVTAFDAGSVSNVHYLVMELIEGESLSNRVARKGVFSNSEIAHILQQAASALEYAHRLGIVHRDIKPGNMMLTAEGTLKILDFGLAILGKQLASTTEPKQLIGTPEYMSPEQIENADQVDSRSDLYSLGATLYFLVAGRPMFTGEHLQVAMCQLRQKPPALYEVRGDVDLRLDAIFQRLVAKRPEDRFSSAGELLQKLSHLHLASSPPRLMPIDTSRLSQDNLTSVAHNTSTLSGTIVPVAIDLGMLASTVARFDVKHGSQIIEPLTGSGDHLRNMLWSDGEQIKIGSEASELRQSQPEKMFHCLQRWIGGKEIQRKLGGKQAVPEVLIAAVLHQLMVSSRTASSTPTHAVVTVPSCYDQMHRRAIQSACRIAGIELMQLLDKPLAGVLSWLDVQSRLSREVQNDSKVVLVVHLGGTGLEASVVRTNGLSATLLGTSGDWQLGSLRWQSALANFFAQQLQQRTGNSIREDVAAATRLQRTVELAFDRLTRAPKVDVRFEWRGTNIDQTVTQTGWLELTPQLTESLSKSVLAACKAAKLETSDIQHVLMIGGMMRMKPLQDVLQRVLPAARSTVLLEKTDLARGAAIQAHYLASLSTSDSNVPHAIGATIYDYGLLIADPSSGKSVPRVLLDNGLPLPTAVSRNLRPEQLNDKQTLNLIESTRRGEETWYRLGTIKPASLFPQRSATDPLQLRLTVDESGLFEAQLLWPAGNQQHRIESPHALSDLQIDHWKTWLETALLCSG